MHADRKGKCPVLLDWPGWTHVATVLSPLGPCRHLHCLGASAAAAVGRVELAAKATVGDVHPSVDWQGHGYYYCMQRWSHHHLTTCSTHALHKGRGGRRSGVLGLRVSVCHHTLLPPKPSLTGPLPLCCM